MVSVSLPAETDVFVVGGGPAGLAAALAARGNGFEVIVADRARPPIDKACGEGLMPDGVASLRRMGVELGCWQGLPFRGIRFVDNELEAEACFPHHVGLGIRRTLLHQALVERAEHAGVVTCWQTPVDALDPFGDRRPNSTMPMDHRGGRDPFPGPPVGGPAPGLEWRATDGVAPAFPRTTLDRPCGGILAQAFPGLCHAGRAGRGVRRAYW
jgi:FAD binding domain